MKKITLISFMFTLGLTAFLGASQTNAKSEGELSAGMVNPGHTEQPDWFKVSFLDLFADIDEAAEIDEIDPHFVGESH